MVRLTVNRPADVPPATPKGRLSKATLMNKTEARYALILEARKRLGEIQDYAFGAVTLKLATDTRYTPDFLVWRRGIGAIEFHEVKGGFMREDALIKLRVAVKQYPMFRFTLCRFTKGAWYVEIVE